MRRFVVVAVGIGVLVMVLGGGLVVGIGALRSGRQVEVTERPAESPDRRVTRFGPGDPRQGSAPVYPSGEIPPPSAPVPSPRDLAAAGDARAHELSGASDTDPPLVVWPVDAEGLNAAMESQHGEVFACYKTLLESYPDAEGRMKVQFHIGADGRVDAAKVVDASYDSLYLEGCIVTAMEDLHFEPPADAQGTLVTRGYEFTSGE